MHLSISGIHMATGDALQARTEERLQGLKKYFDQLIDVNVSFVQETHHNHLHNAEIMVHASGTLLHADGTGSDWYAALDNAAGKLERQLERYKGRLRAQRERRMKFAEKMKSQGTTVTDGVMFESAMFDNSGRDRDDANGLLDRVDKTMLEEFAPEIVRKDVSRVAAMTVDEAIMQMDLLHKPAFLFQNSTSGQLNMVYREGENGIRWVAPKEVEAVKTAKAA